MHHTAEKEVYEDPERLIIVPYKTADGTHPQANPRLCIPFPRVVTDDSSVSKKTRND